MFGKVKLYLFVLALTVEAAPYSPLDGSNCCAIVLEAGSLIGIYLLGVLLAIYF
jgi:hypothetical protein